MEGWVGSVMMWLYHVICVCGHGVCSTESILMLRNIAMRCDGVGGSGGRIRQQFEHGGISCSYKSYEEVEGSVLHQIPTSRGADCAVVA